MKLHPSSGFLRQGPSRILGATLCATALLGLLAACGTTQAPPSNPTQPVAGTDTKKALPHPSNLAGKTDTENQNVVFALAEARWKAMIAGDLDEAYTYMTPSSQQAYPFKIWAGKIRPGLWRTASADSVVCKEDVCNVKINLEVKLPAMKNTVVVPMQEKWLLQNGAWGYFVE